MVKVISIVVPPNAFLALCHVSYLQVVLLFLEALDSSTLDDTPLDRPTDRIAFAAPFAQTMFKGIGYIQYMTYIDMYIYMLYM